MPSSTSARSNFLRINRPQTILKLLLQQQHLCSVWHFDPSGGQSRPTLWPLFGSFVVHIPGRYCHERMPQESPAHGNQWDGSSLSSCQRACLGASVRACLLLAHGCFVVPEAVELGRQSCASLISFVLVNAFDTCITTNQTTLVTWQSRQCQICVATFTFAVESILFRSAITYVRIIISNLECLT